MRCIMLITLAHYIASPFVWVSTMNVYRECASLSTIYCHFELQPNARASLELSPFAVHCFQCTTASDDNVVTSRTRTIARSDSSSSSSSTAQLVALMNFLILFQLKPHIYIIQPDSHVTLPPICTREWRPNQSISNERLFISDCDCAQCAYRPVYAQ